LASPFSLVSQPREVKNKTKMDTFDKILSMDVIILMLLNNTKKLMNQSTLVDNFKYANAWYGYPQNILINEKDIFDELKESQSKRDRFREMFGLGQNASSEALTAAYANPFIEGFDYYDTQLLHSYMTCHYSIYYLCRILKKYECVPSVAQISLQAVVNKSALYRKRICKRIEPNFGQCESEVENLLTNIVANCPSPCHMKPCRRIENAHDYSCRTEYNASSLASKKLADANLIGTLNGTALLWLFSQEYNCECFEGYKWNARERKCTPDFNCNDDQKCVYGKCKLVNGQKKCEQIR
jgi:hypothetical protein